ncbi:hypothetical protein [Candidatus Pristimantibacillus sp. PTI5]|uniref:hypothetical protein n=1 Tax=Candidatus Pristimantibacillus sp. PTI5 TaxID=3400422 RepID=UPI003B012536
MELLNDHTIINFLGDLGVKIQSKNESLIKLVGVFIGVVVITKIAFYLLSALLIPESDEEILVEIKWLKSL